MTPTNGIDSTRRRRLLDRWQREARRTNIQIIDLFVAVMIPAAVAAIAPVPPDSRPWVFIGAACVEAAALFWCAALLRAFAIQSAARRALVGVFAFASAAAWIYLAVVATLEAFISIRHFEGVSISLAGLLSIPVVVASAVVELRRRKRMSEAP